jgi:hypothetical protein
MLGDVSDEDEYAEMNARRQGRMKTVAWIVIIALILVGGGATVLSLLLH